MSSEKQQQEGENRRKRSPDLKREPQINSCGNCFFPSVHFLRKTFQMSSLRSDSSFALSFCPPEWPCCKPIGRLFEDVIRFLVIFIFASCTECTRAEEATLREIHLENASSLLSCHFDAISGEVEANLGDFLRLFRGEKLQPLKRAVNLSRLQFNSRAFSYLLSCIHLCLFSLPFSNRSSLSTFYLFLVPRNERQEEDRRASHTDTERLDRVAHFITR